jgi:hypothetical protein
MISVKNRNNNNNNNNNNSVVGGEVTKKKPIITASILSIIKTIIVVVILLPLIVTTMLLNQQLGQGGAGAGAGAGVFSLLLLLPVVVVESFSFPPTSSFSRTTRAAAAATKAKSKFAPTMIGKRRKSSSTDDATTNNKDASTTPPDVVVISLGSTLNEEEEKEEAYINALINEESVIQYGGIKNGYSGMTSSGYSPFLEKEYTPKWLLPTTNFFNKRKERKVLRESKFTEMNEDGYGEMRGGGSGTSSNNKRSRFFKKIKKPFRQIKKLISKDTIEKPGTLILVRHGESCWNKNKTFTGWADPDLTIQGYREVEHAARLLMEGGYHYDIHVVFTSRLKRAIRSTWILLQEFNEVYLPVFKSWRLNGKVYDCT